ncbi:MAG: acyl-CoA mutase large subunit family protein [Candidatus Anammoxibacter sp.]
MANKDKSDKDNSNKITEKKCEWENSTLSESVKSIPESKKKFTNLSNQVIERLYTSQADYLKDLGFPGEYPFTRGVYPTMYRGQHWTTREFAGFGTAEETNERFKYLLENGQMGLSVAFDLPTLMGRDSDDPMSEGEVGRCGVAIDTLSDMETLFMDIPLDKITTSMTINAPAAVLFAMYVALAEKHGISPAKLEGTIQNDILKEYIAQKEWIYPPKASLRLITDTIIYSQKNTPKWHPVSISGYHIREAGSTAVQELAFTLYDGLTYVEEVVKAGLDIDEFAPRLSFFFNAHNDFFEEIAKFRAARRIWAREIKKRYNPKDPHSLALKFHTQTAGCTLTAQQPYDNIVRVTIQALAGVLGGTQSLHTDSMDETLALPSEMAVRIALRTQQVIAHESGVTNTVDPLGGSYYIESLTNEMENDVRKYFSKLDDLGGMVSAIEKGFPQDEIREASYLYQKEVDNKEKIIVGLNDFITEEKPIDVLTIGPEFEEKQIKRLKKTKEKRDDAKIKNTLGNLKKAARSEELLMPMIIEAVKAYATVGEISSAMKEVFGEYEEPKTL